MCPKALASSKSRLQAGNMELPSLSDESFHSQDVLRCPDCGDTRTLTIQDVDVVVFCCEGCAACWRIELGYVHRVKPRTVSLLNR